MTVCFCGRAGRGFAWHDMSFSAFTRPPPVHCCSMDCLDIATRRKGDMKPDIDEQQAVRAASERIGGYLEGIGKTDLAAMTEAEWMGFVLHAYTSVCEEVRRLHSEELPF